VFGIFGTAGIEESPPTPK